MGFDLALAATATYAKAEPRETFRRHIDAAWIEQALTTTGTATVRRRRLPMAEVVWSRSARRSFATSRSKTS